MMTHDAGTGAGVRVALVRSFYTEFEAQDTDLSPKFRYMRKLEEQSSFQASVRFVLLIYLFSIGVNMCVQCGGDTGQTADTRNELHNVCSVDTATPSARSMPTMATPKAVNFSLKRVFNGQRASPEARRERRPERRAGELAA